MKTISKLIKYHIHLYMRSANMVMPITIYFILLYFFYSTYPVDIVSNFTLTMVTVFFAMTWIGFLFHNASDEIQDQLLILKIQNSICYYLSKVFFLLL